MARYLGLALFAEGGTDHRFLSPVLYRVTDELCARRAQERIDVGPIRRLDPPPEYRNSDRATWIVAAARTEYGAFHILFVHADGAGNWSAARGHSVEPAAVRLEQEIGYALKQTVAVVPVHETEAWAPVDGDALRVAFGTALDDRSLGVPRSPRQVERILDPKQALNQAFGATVGRRRARQIDGSHFLEAIARTVPLARLHRVPAFQRFEQELTHALVDLGYIT